MSPFIYLCFFSSLNLSLFCIDISYIFLQIMMVNASLLLNRMRNCYFMSCSYLSDSTLFTHHYAEKCTYFPCEKHRNLTPVNAYIYSSRKTIFSVHCHALSNTAVLTFLDCGALGLLCTFCTFFGICIWLPESHALSNVNMGLDAECNLSVGLHFLPN